jgi:hypothetical protein
MSLALVLGLAGWMLANLAVVGWFVRHRERGPRT